MQAFTDQGQRIVRELSERYGLSSDAVTHLLLAVIQGNGTMAQFNHPEFGGSGQWMQGGMIMVGDMFNNGLKATVGNLCSEISNLLASQGRSAFLVPVPAGTGSHASSGWWPAELGFPASSGAQNGIRYAWFPASRRLAIDSNGHLTLYDTLDHQIGGVSQQQGSDTSLTFGSQYGTVSLERLPVVSVDGVAPADAAVAPPASPAFGNEPVTTGNTANALGSNDAADVLTTIERLAGLRQSGVLSEEEFAAKKAELLQRL
ncbi:MAG: SHOCT domain-containing protein [Thiothrix sp.]|nr:SHOCT domain-containing protein [Thiothrix sp.]HPQ93951.1 SHOCT domain-containing protein [Thiolinea sp.]